MAELGLGDGTSIPTGIDTRQTYVNVSNPRPDSSSRIDAELVNDLLASTIALQTDLYRTRVVDARTYTTFTEAVAAAANKTLLLCSSVTLDANTTIPDTVSLLVTRPGVINANGFTLTINGSVVGNPMHQWLSGFNPGDIVFGAGSVDHVNILWTGANPYNNNSVDSATAINVAIRAARGNGQNAGNIYSPRGIYYLYDDILIEGYVNFYGAGRGTVFFQKQVSKSVIKMLQAQYSNLHDFSIGSDALYTNGLRLIESHHNTFKHISCFGVDYNAYLLEGCLYNNFFNVGTTSVEIPGADTPIEYPTRALLMQIGPIPAEYPCNKNLFMGCSFNAARGECINLSYAKVNTFIGCTTEGIVDTPLVTLYGVYIDNATNLQNIFIGHYFEDGTYVTADLYDNGNRTLWLGAYGVDPSPAYQWEGSGYSGGNKAYWGLSPDELKFQEDTSLKRTAANALGLASGDALDLQTNSNTVTLKSGANQSAAGAGVGELWVDTSAGSVIKRGV